MNQHRLSYICRWIYIICSILLYPVKYCLQAISLQPRRSGIGPKFFNPIKRDTVYDLQARLGPIESKEILTKKKVIHCYAISDLHADSERGQTWVRNACSPREDSNKQEIFNCIILAGDICTEIDRLRNIFTILKSRYDAVCFVPGNHEAWRQGIASGRSAVDPSINSNSSRMAADSVEKLREVMDCARDIGIHIGPLRIVPDQTSGDAIPSHRQRALSVFPLYSWYHSTFDTEPDLIHPSYLAVEDAIPFERKWGDFSLCSWPEELISRSNFVTTSREIDPTQACRLAEVFGLLNEPHLHPLDHNSSWEDISYSSPICQEDDFKISFSHFLPRQELCPEKRYLLDPLLSRVIGSQVLEEQVSRLRSDLHIFGHTHITMDMEMDGIRYIQWPLGYKKEATRQCAIVHDNGPLLVYDSSLGSREKMDAVPNPLLSELTHWSQYYQVYPRRPHIVDQISPWLENRLNSYSGLVYSQQKRMNTDLG